MAHVPIAATHLEQLRLQLKESLLLDLDEYGLAEQSSGEFNSTYLGLQLNSAFQPIYDTSAGELFGHEALLRPSLGGALTSTPEFAFTYAEQAGKLVQFDRVSRAIHVLNFKQLYDTNGLLFLNVHPKLLVNVNAHGKVFERILHANSVPTENVVIEVAEGLVEQERQLVDALQNYRERGYKIAVDNFGSQHSKLERLWKFTPDFVKVDQSLIQQSEYHQPIQAVLPGLVKMIHDIGAKAIVTGIETQVQLNIAIDAKATLLQGYFLGKPATAKALQPSKLFQQRIHQSSNNKSASTATFNKQDRAA